MGGHNNFDSLRRRCGLFIGLGPAKEKIRVLELATALGATDEHPVRDFPQVVDHSSKNQSPDAVFIVLDARPVHGKVGVLGWYVVIIHTK